MVLFLAWRSFLLERPAYPDSMMMKKGCVWVCWCGEKGPSPTVLWSCRLLWALPRSLHRCGERVPTSEDLCRRPQPPSTLAHPQTRPKLLQNNMTIFLFNFWTSETWGLDALFILKSNLTPSHTAQMFLRFSYFDLLLTWGMNDRK